MGDPAGWTRSAAARRLPALVALGIACGAAVPPLAAEQAGGPGGAAGIARAIEQLGASQFARREASFRSLVQAGRPAVGPLTAAATSADLEVASRAVEILRDMLAGGDAALTAEAGAALATIASRNEPPMSQLAAAALGFHRAALAETARERLTALGAVLTARPAESDGPRLEVQLGSAWHGGRDDLPELLNLDRLECVRVHGVRLEEDVVEILGRLPDVRRIDLYGTTLGPAALATLAARLPTTVIDVRRGGKLGVQSLPAAGSCQISHVQPDSAAERAGLRPGDVIEHLDGHPVANFDEFTRLMAGFGPGEIVSVGIARAEDDGQIERLEPTVRLDAW